MRKPKKIFYIVTIILCLFLGSAIMYGITYFFPNTIIKTESKEKVTVTDEGISKGVKVAYDSVVYISSKKNGTDISTGTGFVYKKNETLGYIITNYHVIENADTIQISYIDDTTATAKLVGGDAYADIAVLTVDASTIKGVATLGDSSKMNIGDTVFTIGAPLGLDYKGTVTRGILSGKDRMVNVSVGTSSSSDWIMNVMQTDAAINPGNSGGPLCNVSGEVIGINSLKIVKSEIEGLGFAIPIEDAIDYAEKIESGTDAKRPYMGIEMANVTDSYALMKAGINVDTSIKKGVLILGVEESSAADKAGIKVGDVIQKINDKEVDTIAEFRYQLYKYSPGDKIKLQIIREKSEKTLELTLE